MVLSAEVERLFALARFTQARRFMEGIFEASRDGLGDIERVTPERLSRAWRELALPRVLTGDPHFEQVGLNFSRLP